MADADASVRVVHLYYVKERHRLEVEFSYSTDGGVTWAPPLQVDLEGTFYSKEKLEARIRREQGLDQSFSLKPKYWRGLISRRAKSEAEEV